MVSAANFSQSDIDTLFKIDHGRIALVPNDVAARFTLVGYVAEMRPTHATARTIDAYGEKHIGVTDAGRMFMTAIRDGIEVRWHEWTPS